MVLTSGTWLNYNPYYQFKCWNPSYPHEFSGKALVRARCEGPWVRKIGYLRIQGILVLNKISVIPYVRPPLHESRGEILHFKHPCLLAVNRIASRTFREKNPHQSRVFFFRLNFNVYNENRERARTGVKKTEETKKNMTILYWRWEEKKC